MRWILLLPATWLMVLSVNAQSGYFVGITGTVGNAWILNQNNYETLEDCPPLASSELAYNLKPGYTAGTAFGYRFKKHYAIQAELVYNKAGQKYEDTFSPGYPYPNPYHVKRLVDLQYLQLPILFKYYSNADDPVQFTFTIGPQFGLRTKASETVEINGEFKTDLDPTTEKFRKFDMGITLGIGTDIYLVPKTLYLHLGLSTYLGLTDINGKQIQQEEWFSKNDVSYQRSINFRAGLNIGLVYIIPRNGSPFIEN